MTTLAEVKRQMQTVIALSDDRGLYTFEAWSAMLTVRKVLASAMPEVWENARGEELEALRHAQSMRCSNSRRHPGTGSPDTPEETWEAMRAASLAGETLRNLSKRFGVIYNAILRRRHQDRLRGMPWRESSPRSPPSNIIQFPRRRSC